MAKKNMLKEILLSSVLGFLLIGCSSEEDDSKDDNPNDARTSIIMEIPNGIDLNNYDWNDANLVSSQNFDTSYLIDENWVFENNYDNTNPDVAGQLQIYTKKNVSVSGGKLKITASKIGEGQGKEDYASSRISGKFAYQYGRIEISAKLPKGEKSGIWAQLALIGENENIVGWPACGEIDLMEYFSHRPNETNITVHSANNNAQNGNLISANLSLDTAEEEFHAYGILWTNNFIKFYIDNPNNIVYTLDKPVNATTSNWPFDQPFYLLAGIAVGGQYVGSEGVDDSIFPAVMEMEYIRVYHAQ